MSKYVPNLVNAYLVVHPQVHTPFRDLTLTKVPANDEQRLLRYLLTSYDKSVRPVYNASHVVTIAIGLTLTHIFNIDEKNQVLSLNVWLEQEWRDQRIHWRAEEFGGLKQLTVPTRFLWTPDIVLYNNAEDFSNGIMQTNVAIYSDGLILWAPPVKFRSTCKLDVSFFPFDEQICHLRFGSWIYDGSQVDVSNRSEAVSLDSYTDHGEWEILDTYVNRKVHYYACCENVPFPELKFTLHLRRRTLFYMYNIIIPCIMLSILTLMQFWLPCESGEKVTLGLTVVLAYSVFSFNIGENMPETSDVIPLIAIYIMCIMSLSSISVTMSVIVLNLRHGGEHRAQVPRVLRFVAIRILAPILCFSSKEVRVDPASVGNMAGHSVNDAFHALSAYILAVATQQQRSSDNRDRLQKESVHVPDAEPLQSCTVTGPSYVHPQSSGYVYTFARQQIASPVLTHRRPSPAPNFDLVKSPRNRAKGYVASPGDRDFDARLRNIIQRTGFLMKRFERENEDEEVLVEWQKVARIFDQLFFWIIFSLTLFITIGMLFMGTKGGRTAEFEEHIEAMVARNASLGTIKKGTGDEMIL